MSDDAGARPPRRRRRDQARAEFDATVADIEAQVRATSARIEADVRATNARIEARAGRNLVLATLIGLGLGLGLLVSLVVVKELFMVFAAGLLVPITLELAAALRFAGRSIPRIPLVVGMVVLIPASFYFLSTGHWLATLGMLVLTAAWRLVEALVPSRRVPRVELGKDLLAVVLVVTYAGFLGSFAVLLTGQPDGQWWTLAFLIVVISTDTGAYASGLSFGKHPMAPRISPKKTWEGFAGSIAAAVLAGILLALFMLGQPWWVGLILGVAIALAATVGDLTESLIKRDLGIKDISTWLPGHGGFLDRLDSVLPSAAVAYALFLVFGSAR